MPTHGRTIEARHWGAATGGEAFTFTLTNGNGFEAHVSNLGATLTKFIMPDARGNRRDIVLGFDTPEQYLAAGTYFGATVGRYGNRIRRGRFRLHGGAYTLACNEGANHLHGGTRAFDKRLWSATPRRGDNAVHFALHSPDGDEGFPGEMMAESVYRLGDDNTFRIELRATVTRHCPVNMVHHTYWNLGGHDSGAVTAHEMQIHADYYTPVDDELMPTGEILKASGPYDFSAAKPIGRDIEAISNGGAGRISDIGGGYDHNFVIRDSDEPLHPVVSVRDPVSGRAFDLLSSEPGVHFYTGGYLAGVRGKEDFAYDRFAGFTLETQKFPDSPNIPHFPSATILPGQTYLHVMEFRFFQRP